jgi:hypothetical protein
MPADGWRRTQGDENMYAQATEGVVEKRAVGESVAPHDFKFANSDISLDEAVADIADSGEEFSLPNLDVLKHVGAIGGW